MAVVIKVDRWVWIQGKWWRIGLLGAFKVKTIQIKGYMTMTIEERIKMEAELASYSGDDRVVSSIELFDIIRERESQSAQVSMMSGIPSLDRAIQSFDGGELTVISGDTGMGKTLFSQTLTFEFFKQGKYVLWFSYEVRASQFLSQFGYPLPAFLLPHELSSSSMDWIRKRMIEAKLKYGLDAVFIDHLHFLIDMVSRNNISLEIGSVMRTLKKMALELNVAIFILAHTNRGKTDSGEPDIFSLRDSSMVGCESDNVLFVWRLVNTPDQAMIKVSKNRKFGVYNFKVKLQKQGKYLREVYDVS